MGSQQVVSGEQPLPEQLHGWLSAWAWGSRSAADVVRDAYNAMADSGRSGVHPLVRRLAQGHSNLGNAERLLRSIVPDRGMPEPVSVQDSIIEWILQPHQLLPWLAAQSPGGFRLHLGGSPDQVEAFWESFLNRPEAAAFRELHPYLRGKNPADLRRHLPLMLFDDAGPVSHVNSSFCRCWYSILGRGGEKQTRFLVCSGLKNSTNADRSWPLILESFARLAEPQPAGQRGAFLRFSAATLST